MPQIPLDAYRVCTVAGGGSAAMPTSVGFASLSLAYGKKLFLTPVRQTVTPIISRRSHLLNHRVYCVAVEPIPATDTHSAQDHSTRCDTLFPGHIHLAALVRVHLDTWKGKDIVISLRALFLAC